MLISDWSSDVGSSDLGSYPPPEVGATPPTQAAPSDPAGPRPRRKRGDHPASNLTIRSTNPRYGGLSTSLPAIRGCHSTGTACVIASQPPPPGSAPMPPPPTRPHGTAAAANGRTEYRQDAE